MVLRNFIIELGLPLSIIEKAEFIRAMMAVDPKFRIPCRPSITKEYLPKLYNKVLDQLKNTCLVADFIPLTFDRWIDRCLCAFYAITMHYVNKIGHLRAHLLAFSHISGEIAYLMKVNSRKRKWLKEVLF